MSCDDIDYGELTRLNPDADVSVNRRKMYGGDSYYITVRLSEFLGSRVTMEENEDTGEEEMCIVIPLRKNNILYTQKHNTIVTFRSDVAQVPSGKYSHVLSPVLTDEQYAERKRLGFTIPIMGSMRPTYFKKSKYKNK